tara:strand:- start:120 stop:290 length:171 start_codon:yes stop_codon:yes gene_type:complete
VSKEIKRILPDAIIKGNSVSPRSGAFEISLNKNLIYSKFKTNCFPSIEDLKELLHD